MNIMIKYTKNMIVKYLDKKLVKKYVKIKNLIDKICKSLMVKYIIKDILF